MSGTILSPESVSLHSRQGIATSQGFAPSQRISLAQRFARRRLHGWLKDVAGGVIHLSDSCGTCTFGRVVPNGLDATMTIRNPEFYRQLVTSGSLGMAESWIRGHWSTDDLTTLLRLFCRNLGRVPQSGALTSAIRSRVAAVLNRLEQNTRKNSRRHIAAHYDLSNEFFQLFLDPTMMYSSAYFEDDSTTLYDASVAKLDRLCRRLNLHPEHHVLEIGTGWGGFALHAARHFGSRITTTTISRAQLDVARQRITNAGLQNRVALMDSDYRDLQGQYDRIVSIEMVEAVGERFLDTYCRQLGVLLRPGGRCVIQAIVMPEDRYGRYRRGIDFIQKYIFPGGFLPSVAALQASIGRTTNLRLDVVEDLSPHYARTLFEWRRNFLCHLDAVRHLDFDERFIRMWEYYLCYCEAAFREQSVRVVQIAWDKPAF